MPIYNIPIAKSEHSEAYRRYCEMTDIEQNFILHLLEKYKPEKILEVGVAAGGTSCLLLKHKKPEAWLCSVDLNAQYYRDKTKTTGYLITTNCSEEERAKHKLYLGYDALECLDEIGNGIDFVVLDTMHILPGEVLHFLAIFKYCKPDAVLVLHDISLNLIYAMRNQVTNENKHTSCTNLLFSAIPSNTKYLPDIELPNIGAVILDKNTNDNIDYVVRLLLISWQYYPDREIIRYIKFIEKNYSDICFKIMVEAAILQKKIVENKGKSEQF